MKKFLLSLVALVITSVCFAQDIIVQKNGSTIQAKVIKVTQTEVEYKKFNNQNGPTYTISTRDLQCINYKNGTKDTFTSSSYNPSIVTNETATQFSNDQQLLNTYNHDRKAKSWKRKAWFAPGVAILSYLAADILTVVVSDSKETGWIIGGVAGVGAGVAWCIYCNDKAKRFESQSTISVHSSPIYQQEFNIGKNDRLMVGVDMLKDNTRKNHTLGLGVSYNF